MRPRQCNATPMLAERALASINIFVIGKDHKSSLTNANLSEFLSWLCAPIDKCSITDTTSHSLPMLILFHLHLKGMAQGGKERKTRKCCFQCYVWHLQLPRCSFIQDGKLPSFQCKTTLHFSLDFECHWLETFARFKPCSKGTPLAAVKVINLLAIVAIDQVTHHSAPCLQTAFLDLARLPAGQQVCDHKIAAV